MSRGCTQEVNDDNDRALNDDGDDNSDGNHLAATGEVYHNNMPSRNLV